MINNFLQRRQAAMTPMARIIELVQYQFVREGVELPSEMVIAYLAQLINNAQERAYERGEATIQQALKQIVGALP